MPSSPPTARPRRRPISPVALIILLALLLAAPGVAIAQDDPVDLDADTSAQIISTGRGDVPSFGGRRPGPIDQLAPPVARPEGVVPIAIQIERAQVDAEIQPGDIIDGAMQDPTGPWVVSWYQDLAGLGEGGNVVMAGHIDYWNVGPAVFYSVAQLAEGDQINVTGENGDVYAYSVNWVRLYEAATAPLDEIVGETVDESLTLITCGGTFDYATGEYLERTVVRATRVEAADQA